nr:PREDICTED: putative trace amine-associated receptor 3 [Austrofundulus limnaeus]
MEATAADPGTSRIADSGLADIGDIETTNRGTTDRGTTQTSTCGTTDCGIAESGTTGTGTTPGTTNCGTIDCGTTHSGAPGKDSEDPADSAICDPLHYPTRINLVKVKYSVCLCWFCAASCSFLYVKDELIEPGRTRSCFGECKVVMNYIVGTFDLIVNFTFPVTAITVLNLRVFVVAVSQARAMRSHITAAALQKSANKGYKTHCHFTDTEAWLM